MLRFRKVLVYMYHYAVESGEVSAELLKEELQEMSTTLREERWHTDDLRKELSALQEALKAGAGPDQEDMIPHVCSAA